MSATSPSAEADSLSRRRALESLRVDTSPANSTTPGVSPPTSATAAGAGEFLSVDDDARGARSRASSINSATSLDILKASSVPIEVSPLPPDLDPRSPRAAPPPVNRSRRSFS
eukprot:GABV01002956.1.p2 GENE.GABV01002956.1~~GABV01002956.1.p2  ORF type:complete len:113 (+),score=35.88 GABV01002956.1:179-517(+)